MEVREPSAKYLSRPSQVLTSAGELPADWIVQPLGELMRLLNGRAFRPDEWSDTGAPIIRIQNLNDPDSDFNFFSGVVDERNVVRPGDLLFAWSGTTGSSFGARVWTGPEGVLNQHIFKVLPDPKKLSSAFAYRLLLKAQYSIERQAHGFKASFVHVKKSDLVSVSAGYPPTLKEQDRIAETLANADALIDSLEQLLTKKHQIKQGAMRELLSGKRRLPGFERPWTTCRLGEISTITMGRTPARLIGSFWGSGHKWLSIADLKGKVVSESKEEVTDAGVQGMEEIPEGTLLMSFKLTIGRLAFAGCNLYTNEAICALRNPQVDKELLYYALSRVDFSLFGKQAVKGYTLNKESLRNVEVPLPSDPEEQRAIAQALANLDAEITALESRLTKARALKQAMAQALLTGRIRLVEPTA